MNDAEGMARALALAEQGFPAPNPHVGCVLVREGRVIAEGYHDHAGGPHAEVVALHAAGDDARGATAYVTLEPCAHHGRTPPCADALVHAGIARVVVAMEDPNPLVAGQGIARLRAAGIQVVVGEGAPEAGRLNERFLTAMRRGTPFVSLKAATTLDGRIALPSGESRWITGEASRAAARRMRAEMGAVLVGRRTVEIDDPWLTARTDGVTNEPLRVVLDPRGRLGREHRVFADSNVVRFVGTGLSQEPYDAELTVGPQGFDLAEVLRALFERGVTGVLVEGGGATLGRFVAAGLGDRLDLIFAGRVFGDGPTWITGSLGTVLADHPEFTLEFARPMGEDLWTRWRPRNAYGSMDS